MLNIFPIQFLALFAYGLLRVVTAGVLLYLATTRLPATTRTRAQYFMMLSEIVLASVLAIGLYTQLAAIGVFTYALIGVVGSTRFAHQLIQTRTFYVLLAGIALSLFITGAGVFAVDLPL